MPQKSTSDRARSVASLSQGKETVLHRGAAVRKKRGREKQTGGKGPESGPDAGRVFPE